MSKKRIAVMLGIAMTLSSVSAVPSAVFADESISINSNTSSDSLSDNDSTDEIIDSDTRIAYYISNNSAVVTGYTGYVRGNGGLGSVTDPMCLSIPDTLGGYPVACIAPKSFLNAGEGLVEHYVNLKSIIIPETMQVICESAFENQTKLKTVYIPRSVTTIAHNSFADTDILQDIYYEGSEEEWRDIDIDKSGNNHLKNAVIHYNSTRESSLSANTLSGNITRGITIVKRGIYTITYCSTVSFDGTLPATKDFGPITIYTNDKKYNVTKIKAGKDKFQILKITPNNIIVSKELNRLTEKDLGLDYKKS